MWKWIIKKCFLPQKYFFLRKFLPKCYSPFVVINIFFKSITTQFSISPLFPRKNKNEFTFQYSSNTLKQNNHSKPASLLGKLKKT